MGGTLDATEGAPSIEYQRAVADSNAEYLWDKQLREQASAREVAWNAKVNPQPAAPAPVLTAPAALDSIKPSNFLDDILSKKKIEENTEKLESAKKPSVALYFGLAGLALLGLYIYMKRKK